MKTLWRLCHPDFVDSAFSGVGASLAGGRWNSPGVRVVYAAESRALALLEQLVHYDVDLIPARLAVIRCDVPETIEIPMVATLEQLAGFPGIR